MGLFKKKEALLDYENIKPDKSLINVVKISTQEVIGMIAWDTEELKYKFATKDELISKEEMEKIISALTLLNKSTILPNWIGWKK